MQLTHLGDGGRLTLPDDLLWTDEHTWTAPVSSVSYLLTGALLVQSAQRQSGRPITLSAPADMAWVRRGLVNTLYQWASAPLGANSGRFGLQMRGQSLRTVAFRHADNPIEATPVTGLPADSDADWYRITLKFMEL